MSVKPTKTPCPTAKIEPCHLHMRPIEMSDADTVAHWFHQIDDVSIFDRQIPLPINHDEVLQLFKSMLADQKSNKSCWFITETLEGALIGMTGLEHLNLLHGNAIIPLFIAEPWRRSGVGIRMACMMIDLAFKQLRLHRVATFYRSDNEASDALIKHLGFTLEGTSRQSWFSHGQHFDVCNAGILGHEWNQIRSWLNQELSDKVTVTLGTSPNSNWIWPGKIDK